MKPRALTIAAACGLGSLWSVAPVAASQQATAGRNTCTITALAPVLTRTSLTGWVSVTCTVATVVSVEFGVVELDGSTEDSKVPIAPATRSIAINAGQTIKVNTATLTCSNTEIGNEEYATKARVNISGTASNWDRTVPKLDSFVC